jgi:hypothetical protein
MIFFAVNHPSREKRQQQMSKSQQQSRQHSPQQQQQRPRSLQSFASKNSNAHPNSNRFSIHSTYNLWNDQQAQYIVEQQQQEEE